MGIKGTSYKENVGLLWLGGGGANYVVYSMVGVKRRMGFFIGINHIYNIQSVLEIMESYFSLSKLGTFYVLNIAKKVS